MFTSIILLSLCTALFYSRIALAVASVHRFLHRSIKIDPVSWVLNFYLTWKHPIRDLSGVRSIPTCPYLWPNGQGDIAKFLDGEKNSALWSNQHGRIYRIWSGLTPEIVLTNAEDVRAVFCDSDKHRKAVNNDSGWLMGELLGDCVGLISGSEYRRVREETAPHFTHKHAASYLPLIQESTKIHFEELQKKIRFVEGKLNPVDDLRLLPFWIVAEILYGKLSANLKLELELITILREKLWSRMLQGGWTRYAWSQHLPTKDNQQLREFQSRWARFNVDACALRTSAHESTPVVEMYAAVHMGEMSERQLLQTLDEMLFANLDVTMGGISWNLLFLANHPEIQHQIRAESDATLKGRDRHARDQYVQSPSTLLAASILESARLRPLAAFSVPQSAPTAREVGGFSIPAGTNCIVSTHKLNISKAYWGDDSEIYRPSRFLGLQASEIRYKYWRFGFGPRQCMGRWVVDIMMRNLLLHIIENCELGLDDDTHWEKNAATWILHPNTEIRCQRLA